LDLLTQTLSLSITRNTFFIHNTVNTDNVANYSPLSIIYIGL
jgi:hypothetical protein